MRKKPFVIKTDRNIDTNFDLLFRNKIESVSFTDCATKHIKSYQEQELGYKRYVDLLSTGTSSTNVQVSFQSEYRDILNIQLQAVDCSGSFSLSVISFTQTSMLIGIYVTGTIDTGAFPFFWQVIGSKE